MVIEVVVVVDLVLVLLPMRRWLQQQWWSLLGKRLQKKHALSQREIRGKGFSSLLS